MDPPLGAGQAAARALSPRCPHVPQVSHAADSFVIAFAAPAPAVTCLMRIQRDLLVVDWPDKLLGYTETRAVPTASDSSQLMWRGLRLRTGCCAGPPVAKGQVAL